MTLERSTHKTEQPFPQVVWDRRPAPRHVGLALGGGAARGFAHVGVLEVLEEAGIPIHMVAGCSVGSVAGALVAAGIPARQIHELVRDVRWNAISTLSLFPHGFPSLNLPLKGFPLGILDLDKLIGWLEVLLGDTQEFARLRLPFAAIATDIVTGEMVIMNEGAVGPAVRASCSVPGIFTPYRRGERLLVDGGVIANLPVQAARQMGAEYVIAVNLLPAPGKHRKEPENIVDLSFTSIYTLIRANQAYGEQADCTIAPDIEQYSLVDMSAAEELIAAGRAAAEAQLPTIRRDLGLSNQLVQPSPVGELAHPKNS